MAISETSVRDAELLAIKEINETEESLESSLSRSLRTALRIMRFLRRRRGGKLLMNKEGAAVVGLWPPEKRGLEFN